MSGCWAVGVCSVCKSVCVNVQRTYSVGSAEEMQGVVLLCCNPLSAAHNVEE